MANAIYTDFLSAFEGSNKHYLNRLIKLLTHLKAVEPERKPKRMALSPYSSKKLEA